jgi:hypothetical protein
MNMNEIQILENWKDKAGGWRWLHYHSMVHYKKINARFVYTSIILSTLAGAGGFSTAGQKSDGSVMGQVQFYMGYVIGVTNVIIGLLNSFQRFGKAAEKTELHANAAMQYSMLQRTLETELSLNVEHRASDLIPRIRQELDRLLSQSPPVPYKIVQEFNQTFPDCKNAPDVCSQLKETEVPSTPTNFMRKRLDNMIKVVVPSSLSLDEEPLNRPTPETPMN